VVGVGVEDDVRGIEVWDGEVPGVMKSRLQLTDGKVAAKNGLAPIDCRQGRRRFP
jgi:hypothetical protein